MTTHQRDLAAARLMLDHVAHGTTHMADTQHRVPVRHYFDPTRWRREMDVIFLRKPLVVAFSAEVREPRSYKALDIMGVPLLITRGDDGAVRVFLNVCRHRGAIVAKEGCGRARSFSCPYHGWTFDAQGKLIGVRREDQFGDVDRAELGLTALASEERDGAIYAVLTPGEPLELDTWLGEFAPVIKDLKLDQCHFYGETRFSGPNWKIAMDGYLENYHFDVLHRATFSTFIQSDTLQFETHGPHMGITFCARSITELQKEPEDKWRPKAHVNTTLNLFPNTIVGFLFEGAGAAAGYNGGMVQIERIFPGPNVDESTTIQTILSTEPLSGDEQIAFARGVQALAQSAVETEDYAMGFDIQAAAGAGANKDFIFGRNEMGLHHFHKMIDELLAQAEHP